MIKANAEILLNEYSDYFKNDSEIANQCKLTFDVFDASMKSYKDVSPTFSDLTYATMVDILWKCKLNDKNYSNECQKAISNSVAEWDPTFPLTVSLIFIQKLCPAIA